MQTIDEMTGYRAMLEGAAYAVSESGYIQLAGVDRIDFLQRQTTNDVKLLSETRAVLTVLTSATARILDVLWLITDGDSIRIMTVPQRGAATAKFMGGKIFFMDKVTVEDQSATVAQYDLEGPQLGDALVRLGLSQPDVDKVRNGDIEGVGVRIVGRRGLFGGGVRLIVPAGDAAKIEAAMNESGMVRASQDAYEMLRIEAGQAGINELTEEFTPLEVGLNHAVSDSKGCYTGQEIIARQITYDKVTKSLVGLRLDAPIQVGDGVVLDGRNVGVVTSAGESPRFGAIGLAVVKRPHHEPDGEIGVGDISGRVVSLPISE
jgi:tRNA-modifying protein YgfZ